WKGRIWRNNLDLRVGLKRKIKVPLTAHVRHMSIMLNTSTIFYIIYYVTHMLHLSASSHDEWVASWKKLYQVQRWTWINVYAYFRKGQDYGGYGAILRNELAKPIIASAKFSKDEKSFYYQVFMGIKAGVELAEKHGRSFSTSSVIRFEMFETCISVYVGRDWRLVHPVVMELRDKNIRSLTSSWNSNPAAHYLAKREKRNKRPQVEKKEDPDDEKPGEIEPDDFPQELKDILWRDAFVLHSSCLQYCRERNLLYSPVTLILISSCVYV
ncbi:hypothetical protein MKX01_001448, partial [Papaver californicum]